MLVAHYRNAGLANGETSSVAMGVALLQYLAQAKWLAKDIVLLVADGALLPTTICHVAFPPLTTLSIDSRWRARWH